MPRLPDLPSILIASALLSVAMAGTAMAQGTPTAEEIIKQHTQLPVFEPQGEPFDAKSCMAGKKMLTIPVSSANPFNKAIIQSEIEAATAIGFEVTEWENQGQPTQWVQGVEYAMNNGFDAIELLGGSNPAVLGPQIAAARAAGLKVYVSDLYDTTQTPDPGIDSYLATPYTKVGDLLANWVIYKSGGKANVLIVGSDEVPPTKPYVSAITDRLKADCPECKWSYVNAPIPEWSTKVQSGVQSALIADPTIDYVIPIYDSMSQFAIPAIRIAGKQGQVKIATFNGTPFVLDALRNGEVEMDIGKSIGWVGRTILDAYMRDLCGLPTYTELYAPLYIFDASNVETAGVPAQIGEGYGTAYIDGFNKLWGL
jgi:ribose transport system substrate-binding protein